MTRVATWIVVLSALVKLFSLPRALSIVSAQPRKRNLAWDHADLSSAVDSVLGINIFVFTPNCWKRASVLHRYLALQGTATSIVFGVRTEADGELKGHAWLEAEGKPLLEQLPPAYRITYTFPSADRFDGELALMTGARN